ncbi:MAG: GntR family transcriptional regulator [Microbacteriaceae bacterium]|jgi:GntR family transcriptional regulator|nr:GntR family transcriptional regulator [Microbacteriaceae bacterium]
MLIDIDPDSESPLYQQLRDQVVRAIAEGSLKPGEALASVRQLAGQFGINSATVGKGYELLRQEGLVRTSRRSGSVVARGPADEPTPGFSAGWTGRLRTLLAEAVAHGMPDQSIRDTTDSLLADFAASRTDSGRSAS